VTTAGADLLSSFFKSEDKEKRSDDDDVSIQDTFTRLAA
jgi:hypothetical protein